LRGAHAPGDCYLGPVRAEATWGEVEPAELARIVVVSPHLDDAALGAGQLLTTYGGSTVITVFAGRPPAYPAEPTDWDALGGFVAGDDIVAVRRQEDRSALEILGAVPRWLEFSDHQYLASADRPRPEHIAPDLAAAIDDVGPSAVFLPMGLANPDHGVTHDAGLLVRDGMLDSQGAPAWFCYEDAGYKHIPGILAHRVSKLFRSGLWPTPAVVPVQLDTQAKRSAIFAYKSQVAPLQRDHSLDERLAANVPEQFWRLAPPPQGWEVLADL
jgi:LmbE family N-acetylglucosaminyl deacetylase